MRVCVKIPDYTPIQGRKGKVYSGMPHGDHNERQPPFYGMECTCTDNTENTYTLLVQLALSFELTRKGAHFELVEVPRVYYEF